MFNLVRAYSTAPKTLPRLPGQRLETRATRLFDPARITRIFSPGDTYTPADLKAKNVPRIAKKMLERPKPDPLELLRIDSRDLYKNVAVLSEFVTDMGMIKSRRQTNLNRQNHKNVAKAIRRARCMGLMPWTYKLSKGGRQPGLYGDEAVIKMVSKINVNR